MPNENRSLGAGWYAPPAVMRNLFRVDGPPQPLGADRRPPFWLLGGIAPDLRQYVRRYDEEIAAADLAAADIFRTVTELRPGRPNIFVLAADHGEEFLDHGGWEHGHTLYDELVRVPLIVAAPDLAPARVETQVQLIDVYPTLLELAHVADSPAVAGVPFTDLLDGRHVDARPAFSELGDTTAVRWLGWKCIYNGRTELYNLTSDPHERQDVAGAEPVRAELMLRLLSQHNEWEIAQGAEITHRTVPMRRETLEQLRALGYMR